MSNISQFLQAGENIGHTPAALVSAGNIIQVGALSAFASHDIAAGVLGAVAVSGVIQGPYVGQIANVGDNVWWDANGTPYGGAATGAFTTLGTAGDWWVGTLVAPTSVTGTTCDIALNVENPNLPAWPHKTHITTAVDLAVSAATHSGCVLHVTAADKTITTPATGVEGMEFIVQNDMADGATKLIVDLLHATEHQEGANLTIANTKTADLTKLTSVRGDFLHFRCCVATAAWVVLNKRGIWVTSA